MAPPTGLWQSRCDPAACLSARGCAGRCGRPGWKRTQPRSLSRVATRIGVPPAASLAGGARVAGGTFHVGDHQAQSAIVHAWKRASRLPLPAQNSAVAEFCTSQRQHRMHPMLTERAGARGFRRLRSVVTPHRPASRDISPSKPDVSSLDLNGPELGYSRVRSGRGKGDECSGATPYGQSRNPTPPLTAWSAAAPRRASRRA